MRLERKNPRDRKCKNGLKRCEICGQPYWKLRPIKGTEVRDEKSGFQTSPPKMGCLSCNKQIVG